MVMSKEKSRARSGRNVGKFLDYTQSAFCTTRYEKVKVKQTRYSPGVAQRVPGS
jgi:hypothetical protein